ncbi:MAG: LysE family translocator [Minwuiales bacterium]|nr:LysE family translocator [Minwuiales bacterium]
MDIFSILAFAAVIAVATATPGPTVVTLVARVLATGRSGNLAFALGLIVGDLFWLACAVFGIAAIAVHMHEVMVVLKYLGAAYLLYLAYRLWTAPPASPNAAAQSAKRRPVGAIAGGLAIAIANPKTMMFYLALLPNLIDVAAVDIGTFVRLSVVVATVYAGVLAAYMAGALRARHLFTSPRALRAVNRGSAAIMTGTAAYVATRS